ncbi:MAG: lysoplasmalogenase [Thermodesulfobacteriota bacterium]
MLNLLIVMIAAVLMITLLYFEKLNNWKKFLPVKTVLSCLFIFTAVVQPHPLSGYYGLILLGLVFCLGGDVFLALPQKKMFLLGLVSFLVGHVFYVLAFLTVAGMNGFAIIGTLLTIGVSAGVYRWLKPHLGTMKIPVIFYILVISAMLCGAWAILGETGLERQGRRLVFIGALSFYVSDLFVARDRFLKDEFLNRMLGLPLYYAGQFMLAFSVGVLQ